MSKDLIKRIEESFNKAFDLASTAKLSLESLERGTHPWDSLKHLELLNILEKDFKVQLSLESCLAIKSLKSAKEEIESYLERDRL